MGNSRHCLGLEPYQQWLTEGRVVKLQSMATGETSDNNLVVLTSSDS